MKYLQSFGRYVFLNFTHPSLKSLHFILRCKYTNKTIYPLIPQHYYKLNFLST